MTSSDDNDAPSRTPDTSPGTAPRIVEPRLTLPDGRTLTFAEIEQLPPDELLALLEQLPDLPAPEGAALPPAYDSWLQAATAKLEHVAHPHDQLRLLVERFAAHMVRAEQLSHITTVEVGALDGYPPSPEDNAPFADDFPHAETEAAPAPPPADDDLEDHGPVSAEDLERQHADSMDAIGAGLASLSSDPGHETPLYTRDEAVALARQAGIMLESAQSIDDRLCVTLTNGDVVDLDDPKNHSVERMKEILSLLPIADDETLARMEDAMRQPGGAADPIYLNGLRAFNEQHKEVLHHRDGLKAAIEQSCASVSSAPTAAPEGVEDNAGGTVSPRTASTADQTSTAIDMAFDRPLGRDSTPLPAAAQPSRAFVPAKSTSERGSATDQVQIQAPPSNPLSRLMYGTAYTAADSIRQLISGSIAPWRERNAKESCRNACAQLASINGDIEEYATADTSRRAELLDGIRAKISIAAATSYHAVDAISVVRDEELKADLARDLHSQAERVNTAASALPEMLNDEERARLSELAASIAEKLSEVITKLIERISLHVRLRQQHGPASTYQAQPEPDLSM